MAAVHAGSSVKIACPYYMMSARPHVLIYIVPDTCANSLCLANTCAKCLLSAITRAKVSLPMGLLAAASVDNLMIPYATGKLAGNFQHLSDDGIIGEM